MNKLDMSLEAIAQQNGGGRGMGGRSGGKMSRSLKFQDNNNNGDVDMEANNNNNTKQGGNRRNRNNNRQSRMGGGRNNNNRNRGGAGGVNGFQQSDFLSSVAGIGAGGSRVIVVNSIEEAARLANRGGGNYRGIQMARGGNGGGNYAARQNEHAFRNFSSNRRQIRKRQPGVLVRIEGLDNQIIAEELSELVKQEFPNSFLRAYLEYDNTERSLGRGGIYFKTYEDAQNAIEVFSAKRLDGKPMCLYLAEGNEHRYSNNINAGVNNGNNNMNSQRW